MLLGSRVCGGCTLAHRARRFTACLIFLGGGMFLTTIFGNTNLNLPREDQMEQQLAVMQSHLQFIDSLYRTRQEDVIVIQSKLTGGHSSIPRRKMAAPGYEAPWAAISPELAALLKKLSGTRAASGFRSKNLSVLRRPFEFQLLPHLMDDPYSLRPAYHMKGGRTFAHVVIGIPTVKRDKESYIMTTLTHLINGMSPADRNTTLIVIFIGETDMKYVINTARQIEKKFPKYVESGLIEVLSPAATYYPNLNDLPTTLGDSLKRVKWRTKQNLDTIYLMAYAQTKGTFYLMLEDDVIAKRNYMHEIKQFTAAISISTPNWFFLEFCHVGGIGKLFRSSDLVHFIVYVQLFYNNMPIDWLLESYLADRVCTIDKTSKVCMKNKMDIRPKYKSSLFQHIGLYSSLKGKIQKVKDPLFGAAPTYYPHNNPPLRKIRSDIQEHSDHTIQRAYDGQTFFWGTKPRKGDLVEFWFKNPVLLESYTFRSGNVEHITDRFYDTTVEIVPAGNIKNITVIGSFDEFGLADGVLKKETGPISAI